MERSGNSTKGLLEAGRAEGTVATAASSSEEFGTAGTRPESSRLLHRFDVLPTSSKQLQGLKDVIWLLLIIIPFLALRAARYILSWLGVTEHRWKGARKDEPLSKGEREQLQDVIVVLRGNNVPQQTLSQAITAVATGADGRPGALMLAHLSAVTTALEASSTFHALPYDEVQRQSVLMMLAGVLETYAHRERVDALDVLKSLRRAGKHAVQKLARQTAGKGGHRQVSPEKAARHFAFELLMQTSRAQPPVSTHVLMQLDDGSELVESCTIVPLDIAIEFLRTQGDPFSRHVAFMSQFPHLRPSDAKKQDEVQAMTINSRIHALHLRRKDGSVTEIASFPRSGAFATHGRQPRRMGLAGLINYAASCRQAPPPLRQAALAQYGYQFVEQVQEEIEARRVRCLAQALPLIVKAITLMCTRPASMESAVRAGSFLYVQQSLLSDLNSREGAYIQDLRGALDEVSSSLQVRFEFKPSRALEVQGRRVILHLDRDAVPESAVPPGMSREDLLSRTYGVTTLLFSCGVNVLQSLGFFLSSAGGETTQDLYNRQAMERINDYAALSGHTSSPALSALNHHYGPGATREPKDVESVWLVRDATRELGGSRAVNCKSGKDRTAMEIAISFTQEATRQLGLSSSQQRVLCQAAMGGLSYELTSQNNGRPCAYAFNEFELVTMPHGWAPEWRLCGKVET